MMGGKEIWSSNSKGKIRSTSENEMQKRFFFFSSWFGFGRSFILNGVEEMTEVGNGEQEEEEGLPIALAQLAARSLPLPSPALPVQFALTALIMSITPVTPRGGERSKKRRLKFASVIAMTN